MATTTPAARTQKSRFTYHDMVRFGWTANEACPARTDSAAVGSLAPAAAADSDTWQTIHGPIAVTDTAVAATVRTVTASGQRRRRCIAARDATPSARSPQNSVRADCHWSPATDSQSKPRSRPRTQCSARSSAQGSTAGRRVRRCSPFERRSGRCRHTTDKVDARNRPRSSRDRPVTDARRRRCPAGSTHDPRRPAHQAVRPLHGRRLHLLLRTPGDITGFLGPNGAGKSTTMRVMVGLTVRRPAPRPSTENGSQTYPTPASRSASSWTPLPSTQAAPDARSSRSPRTPWVCPAAASTRCSSSSA